MKRFLRMVFSLGVLLMMGGVVGCKTEDELSSRPWNTPKSWETGLPAALTEGR